MPEAPAQPNPAAPESPAAAATPPAAPTPPVDPKAQAPEATSPASGAPANPWEDPEAAKAEIEKLRRENGAARTNAKAQAAKEAEEALTQRLAKALGLVEDDKPLDPAALTANLTAAQTEAKQAKIELAAYRAASAPDADFDPAALLDSRTFLEKVANIDPADSAALSAVIAETVELNPRLRKATTPGMKPNPAQGASASPPMGLGEQIAAAQAAGDLQAVMRLKAQQMVSTPNS